MEGMSDLDDEDFHSIAELKPANVDNCASPEELKKTNAKRANLEINPTDQTANAHLLNSHDNTAIVNEQLLLQQDDINPSTPSPGHSKQQSSTQTVYLGPVIPRQVIFFDLTTVSEEQLRDYLDNQDQFLEEQTQLQLKNKLLQKQTEQKLISKIGKIMSIIPEKEGDDRSSENNR